MGKRELSTDDGSSGSELGDSDDEVSDPRAAAAKPAHNTAPTKTTAPASKRKRITPTLISSPPQPSTVAGGTAGASSSGAPARTAPTATAADPAKSPTRPSGTAAARAAGFADVAGETQRPTLRIDVPLQWGEDNTVAFRQLVCEQAPEAASQYGFSKGSDDEETESPLGTPAGDSILGSKGFDFAGFAARWVGGIAGKAYKNKSEKSSKKNKATDASLDGFIDDDDAGDDWCDRVETKMGGFFVNFGDIEIEAHADSGDDFDFLKHTKAAKPKKKRKKSKAPEGETGEPADTKTKAKAKATAKPKLKAKDALKDKTPKLKATSADKVKTKDKTKTKAKTIAKDKAAATNGGMAQEATATPAGTAQPASSAEAPPTASGSKPAKKRPAPVDGNDKRQDAQRVDAQHQPTKPKKKRPKPAPTTTGGSGTPPGRPQSAEPTPAVADAVPGADATTVTATSARPSSTTSGPNLSAPDNTPSAKDKPGQELAPETEQALNALIAAGKETMTPTTKAVPKELEDHIFRLASLTRGLKKRVVATICQQISAAVPAPFVSNTWNRNLTRVYYKRRLITLNEKIAAAAKKFGSDLEAVLPEQVALFALKKEQLGSGDLPSRPQTPETPPASVAGATSSPASSTPPCRPVFVWSPELEASLQHVVDCYAAICHATLELRKVNYSAVEYDPHAELKKYLKATLVPMWPKGWMAAGQLYRKGKGKSKLPTLEKPQKKEGSKSSSKKSALAALAESGKSGARNSAPTTPIATPPPAAEADIAASCAVIL